MYSLPMDVGVMQTDAGQIVIGSEFNQFLSQYALTISICEATMTPRVL